MALAAAAAPFTYARATDAAVRTGVSAELPSAPACERNRDPILEVLQRHLRAARRVLEIGSGTGQHAVHFAAAMPWLTWQCSDRRENLPDIDAWIHAAQLPNTPPPLELDVLRGPWPAPLPAQAPLSPAAPHEFDAAFSANTLHIMGWPAVEAMFKGLGAALGAAATIIVYGPFNYDGAYTSASNGDFDAWLKSRDAASGIREFEAVDGLARTIGLRLIEDVAMPANNRCLVWRR